MRQTLHHAQLRRTLNDVRLPRALTGLLLLAGAVWIMRIGRDAQFWSDDFAFVVFRQGHSAHVFFDNFNGHFAFFPIVAYKVLLAIFGMHHYWPFRAVVLIVHLVTLVLVHAYTRRRVGEWGALAAVALLVIYGAAVELYVYPVNVGFQLALATGVGALLLLDEAADRRRAIGATVLLTIGIASSTVSLCFLLAAIVDVARRPERRALWWVPAVPLVVYLIWSAGYGDGQLVWKNLGQVWAYSLDGVARSTGGLVALDENWGRAIAVAILGFVAWRAATVDRLVALVAGLLGFWALTAMARAQLGTEGAERFLYPSAVLVVLIVAEAARGLRVPARLGVVLPFAVAGIVLANGFASHDSAQAISVIGETTSGGLRALALAAPNTQSTAQVPEPYYGANARQLAGAVRNFGAPGGAPADLGKDGTGAARSGADTMLRAVAGPPTAAGPIAAAGAPGPTGAGVPAGTTARTRGGCLVVTPSAPNTTVEIALPPTGLIVQATSAPVAVRTRRFAGYGNPDVTVAPGQALQLHLLLQPAGSTSTWDAQLTADAPFRACAPAKP